MIADGADGADGEALLARQSQRLLTADDVAEILGVPRTLVYALVRGGELPAVRVGERYVRFRAEAIERWIESREVAEPRVPRRNAVRRRPQGIG